MEPAGLTYPHVRHYVAREEVGTLASTSKDGRNWGTENDTLGRESWKSAPSRETTHDAPGSEDVQVAATRKVEENVGDDADAKARAAANAKDEDDASKGGT
jgi:hypothetical protein